MPKKFEEWTREEMLGAVKEKMTEQRYVHTLGVVRTAIELAKWYGADADKAEIAAIFHDYAKFRDEAEMAGIIKAENSIPDDLLDYHKELWHAPVGAYLVQQEFGLNDEEILQAIRSHTTGRPRMTTLEKVVCLADYIEPSRQFPGVDEIRHLAKVNLDEALAKALFNTIQFLEHKGQNVYPVTRAAYEFLSNGLGKTNDKKGGAFNI